MLKIKSVFLFIFVITFIQVESQINNNNDLKEIPPKKICFEISKALMSIKAILENLNKKYVENRGIHYRRVRTDEEVKNCDYSFEEPFRTWARNICLFAMNSLWLISG